MTTENAPSGAVGCCSWCKGTGYSGESDTGGICSDCRGTGCAHPDPCEEIRERVARAIFEEGAWAGDCCDHTDFDACGDCQRVCLAYADAALAALATDRPGGEA